MWFEIINAFCWIGVFTCFYLILNPNIEVIKNFHISPYKKKKYEHENKYNVSELFKNYNEDKLIKISKLFMNNFDVMIFNFNGSLNVGNIMRLSCIYGANNYYIVGRKVYDSRSCVGANRYLNVHILKDIILELPDKSVNPKVDKEKFRNFFIDNNLQPIFIEQGGNYINEIKFNELKTDKKFVFIFGNESYGIDKEVIDYCKDIKGFTILSIPQIGILRSLNVSNSASIILWEYYKQVLSN